MENLRNMLQKNGVLILDGAMGTELSRRGVQSIAKANLDDPETVGEVHKTYLAAGSNAIITNTLTLNRINIESHHMEIDVGAVNRAGAAIAASVASAKAYVLGNLSSTGQMLEPYGTYSETDFMETYAEQASYLQDGKVDGFIIETVFDLREAVCALKGCKAVSALPVVVCMAFSSEKDGGRTVMGDSARDCAAILTDNGADALGANCGGLDPDELARIVAILAATTKLPIVAEPNAGKPALVNGATVFSMEPGVFAAAMKRCREAGACILGGCCGTTPAHITALRNAIRLGPIGFTGARPGDDPGKKQ
jgi:5-methyltetrahydrofolate--homocysteine methyltransferase